MYDIIDTASDLAKRQFPHCEPGAREPNPLPFKAFASSQKHDTHDGHDQLISRHIHDAKLTSVVP